MIGTLGTRRPRPNEEKALRELWQQGFPGEEPYLECYFKNRYQRTETLILEEDKVPVCMMATLPMTAVTPDGARLEAMYLYAVTTREDRRRLGFLETLLQSADMVFRAQKKDCALVVPANDASRAAFEKGGFHDAFSLREFTVEDLPETAAAPVLKPAEYRRRREAMLKGHYYVSCNTDAIEFARKFARVSGGDLYGIGRDACALAERLPDGTVLIKELLTDPGEEDALIAAVAAAMKAKRCVVRTPEWLCTDRGEVRPFGLIRGYDRVELPGEPGWLGIAYD